MVVGKSSVNLYLIIMGTTEQQSREGQVRFHYGAVRVYRARFRLSTPLRGIGMGIEGVLGALHLMPDSQTVRQSDGPSILGKQRKRLIDRLPLVRL